MPKFRKCIGFSKTSIYWTSRGAGRRCFTKQTLVNAMSFFINKFFFAIGNIGIPMGTDPERFWAYLLLYFFKFKYMEQLILNRSSKACKCHGVSKFIDDLFAINDGNEFLTSLKNICPKEVELIAEHRANHASFLDLGIKI